MLSKNQPFDSPLEKMQIMRAKLLAIHPFFARLAYKLNLVEDRRYETAATNGISLFFNPEHVWNLKTDEAVLLWAHEVLHPAMHHDTRRGGRDAGLWNQACDYVVNDILKKSGFDLPSDYLHDSVFENMTAERVYEILDQSPPGNGPNEAEDNSDDQGQGQGEDQQQGKDQGDDQGQGQDQEGDDQDQNDDQGDDQGQQNQGDGNDKISQGGRPGDVLDYPGEGDESGQTSSGEPDENDLKRQEQSWDTATANAAQIAKARGSMPGSLQDMVDDLFESVIDWRDILRHFLERVAANDYSWEQPDRRYIQRGIYLPSLYNHELGDIVVAVDTSCSRTREDLQQDAAEISEILGLYDAAIHLIFVDTSVQGYEQYTRENLPLEINFLGRGGTCFTPAFDWVSENEADLNVTAMLYLTDMECNDFPDPAPEYPVLWIQNGDYNNPPPFGELVKM
jgi:predicted metal-dependent peptidase